MEPLAPPAVANCYKHPDRPAGIVCQRCDRPICPQCMHQASVGFHCPECTKKGAQKVYQGVASLRVRPVLTQILMGVNLAVFAIGLALSGNSSRYVKGDITEFHIDWASIAKSPGLRITDGWIGVGEGEWYRIVTSGFLHFGILHIAINMWGLWILGQAVEQFAGRLRFGVIYGVSLLAGSFGSLLLEPGAFSAGASGAIFGLMGALFLALRAQGVPTRNSPLLNVLLLNLFITFAIPGISKGAHLGGLAGGALAGWILFDLARRPGLPKWVPMALCAAVALASVVGSIVVANAYQY